MDKAISLLLQALDASKEVEALERGPEYDYTVRQMLTREFLEQVPRSVLEGIPGLRLLPSSDGKEHRPPHRRIDTSGEAGGERPTRDH